VIVFAASDKGGTGRSVTSANVMYRRALTGSNVAYLDFDFGSPTSGAIFSLAAAPRGTAAGGLHSYLQGAVPRAHRLDVWRESDREGLQGRPDGAGRLTLLPGDTGGGEFPGDKEIIRRCVALLLRMEEEFEFTLVDLSAGRSFATNIVLAACASPELRSVNTRWLVFHRWTRQHIIAAQGLVAGTRGIIETGVSLGLKKEALASSIRFVHTAVVNPNSDELAGLRAEQVAWLRECNIELQRLASSLKVGRATLFGSVPLDPVLQWREQLITDFDTMTRQIANRATVDSFKQIAEQLDSDDAWIGI
jgi:hypothetical protein